MISYYDQTPGGVKFSLFDAEILNLRKILSRNQTIPDMQRPFEWQTKSGAKHVPKLWDDLLEYHYEDQKKQDVYYTGTMICYPEKSHFSIIDGQQRITTISLIFIAMRDLIDTSSLKPEEEVLFSEESIRIKDIHRKISKVAIGSKKKPRLLPKQDDNYNAIAYEWLLNRISRPVNSTVDNPKSKLLVLQAYRFLKSKLKSEFNNLDNVDDLTGMMSFADHLLDGVVFNLTTVTDMAQGYRIFSSENTTGLKLNHMDITRALVIAQLDRRKLRDAEIKVRRSLASMSKNMDGETPSTKNKFIRTYYGIDSSTSLAPTALLAKVSSSIKRCRKVNQIQYLSKDLDRWSKVYADKILHPTSDMDHFRIHHDLVSCGFDQHKPLLLALLMRKDAPNKDEIDEILSIVEVILVKYCWVAKLRTNMFEQYFFRWANKAKDDSYPIEKITQKILLDLKDILPKVDNFEDIFSSLSLKRKHAIYLLSKIERYENNKLHEISDFSNVIHHEIIPNWSDYDGIGAWKDVITVSQYYKETPQKRIGNFALINKPKKRINSLDSWDLKKQSILSNAKKFTNTRKRLENLDSMYVHFVEAMSDELAQIANKIWCLEKLE